MAVGKRDAATVRGGWLPHVECRAGEGEAGRGRRWLGR